MLTGPALKGIDQSDSWATALGSAVQHAGSLLGKGVPERGRCGSVGLARAARRRGRKTEGNGGEEGQGAGSVHGFGGAYVRWGPPIQLNVCPSRGTSIR
jgi:hypothetical protein